MYIKEVNIKNRVYNYCFHNFIRGKKIVAKNILSHEKNYKDLVIYFTRYVYSKSIKYGNIEYGNINDMFYKR